jgi:hypothetical protein
MGLILGLLAGLVLCGFFVALMIWGVLVDNEHNYPRRLHDLMDFNQSFNAYDTIEGANCLTTFGVKMTQKEAALQAVKAIGLNQICEVDSAVFQRVPQYEKMFRERLVFLKSYNKCN